jgi:hypothetical protein
MTCTHRFDGDDVCIDCGYDDGLQHMPTAQRHELLCTTFARAYGLQGLCICDEVRDVMRRASRSKSRVIQEAEHWRTRGYAAGLNAAREAVAALHQRVPVIECACGWGKDCPECGEESNRVVGYACDACCNSFGDHAYCDDMHDDMHDEPLHHRDGRWNGPHCPVIAAIDELREKP